MTSPTTKSSPARSRVRHHGPVLEPVVRLVVLNYNGGELVERCVRHLEALEWPEDRLQIVVVDNASADGSDEALEGRPRVRLLRSPVNVGFPGNNLALRDLDGVDFVGLINNDAFVEPGFLRPLVAALIDDGSIGAACPKILLADRFVDLTIETGGWHAPGDGRELGVRLIGLEVDGHDRWRSAGFIHGVHAPEPGGEGKPDYRWTAGSAVVRVPVTASGLGRPTRLRVRVSAKESARVMLRCGGAAATADVGAQPTWIEMTGTVEPFDVVNNAGSVLVEGGWGADRGFLHRDRGQFDEPTDVFAWCGGAVLLRSQYLREVGLFDERFFMYYEDTDLSWRGRAQGWRYRYVPTSVVRHVHAATSVEGSPMFHHYVERNRLAMLTKNAPGGFAAQAAGRFLLSTMSYARRDLLRPLVRRRRPAVGLVRARLSSFLSYVALLPHLLRERRGLRRRQLVPDDELLGWAVPQPPPPS